MSSFQEVLNQIRCRGWITEEMTTALYPCSGTDTKAFTFTHPAFFVHRGIVGIPSPNVFIYVDSRDPLADVEPRLEFGDGLTLIETRSSERTTIYANDGYLFDLVWESKASTEWGRLSHEKAHSTFRRG